MWVQTAGALVSLFIVAGCATWPIPSSPYDRQIGPWRGQFVDAETAQPIPGVMVLAWWQRLTCYLFFNDCVGPFVAEACEGTVSDAEGRFVIPAHSSFTLSPVHEIRRHVQFFKGGYDGSGWRFQGAESWDALPWLEREARYTAAWDRFTGEGVVIELQPMKHPAERKRADLPSWPPELNATCARRMHQATEAERDLLFRARPTKADALSGLQATGSCINCDLRDADLTGIRLPRANLTGARLVGSILTSVDLSGATLSGAFFTRAFLIDAKLAGANLTRARLDYARLTRADLTGALLYHADLTRADLTGASLQGTALFAAKLSGANLRGADLRGASLREADLYEADLTGANLSGADLDFALLTRATWVDGRQCGERSHGTCK